MSVVSIIRSMSVAVAFGLIATGTVMAEPADEPAPDTDAWTAIEDKQLGLAMAILLDDAASIELRKAAMQRYSLDEDASESFIICMLGLAGHPDFTTARVSEAMDVCSRNRPPSRN